MTLSGWRSKLNNHWARSWFDSEHLEKALLETGLVACQPYARGLLLDVGCGQRRHEHIFTPVISRYVGLDYPPVSGGVWATTGGERVDIWGDGQWLPVASNAVDTVLCTQVLEHVPEPSQLMRELARVLKPGGHAIITAPQEWGVHQEPFDYYRYTPYGLRYLAEKAGLEVLWVRSRGGFWAMMGQRWSAYWYDTTCRRLRRRGNRVGFLLCAIPILPLAAMSQLLGLGLDRIQYLDRNTLGYVLVARKPA
jgi:SAM-dependent methyltransferase